MGISILMLDTSGPLFLLVQEVMKTVKKRNIKSFRMAIKRLRNDLLPAKLVLLTAVLLTQIRILTSSFFRRFATEWDAVL